MLKVQEIRELIRLIDQSSISEFTYETNESTITLKKTGERVPIERQNVVAPSAEPKVEDPKLIQETTKAVEKVVEVPQEMEEVENESYDFEITSPMVGTFYRAASPDSDPYVEVGSKVSDETIVCIVEAMKLFNEIEAEVKGEIVEILVGDGELVEYGQPLFRVKKDK